MKIKITKDENDYIDQMFQNSMKSYNYLKTDILLFLIYGEDIRWSFCQDDETFYIMKQGNYLTELSRDEWKKMFTENCISIDKTRTYISILATPEIEKKFLNLLEELKIDFKIKHENALNKILKGDN